MNIWKSLLILGITIGLSTLILGSIFTYFRYFRTRREIPGGQNYERGSQRLQQRDYKGAIEAFTQALRLNPNLIEAYTSRGNARLLLGDKPGALEDYNHALHLNPNCANVYYQRGNAYSDLGNKHEAIKDYQIAAKLFFEQKDTANYQLTLNKLKKLQQQRTGSTSAVNNQDNPQSSQTQHTDTIYTNQNAEDFLNQGLNKARQGDYREAIANFDRAIQINHNSAEIYHNRGLAHFKVGEIARAIEDFTQALRLNADYTEAYVGRGNAYRQLRDYQGAIIDYTQLLRIYPEDAKAYYNRGVSYVQIGDKKRAIEDYQKAVKLFYAQGDEVNCKRALDSLKQFQAQAMHSDSAENFAKPFNHSSTSTHISSRPNPQTQDQDNKLRFDQAKYELQKKLMTLLHEDRNLAMRLLSQVKMKDPGKSIDWYVEKVIYDLERDRRR